jgi:hypothetical protein
MPDLYFEVDTSPMARSVDSVNGHVHSVTTAVTAMEAAVIAAERQSARTICENVDHGFYVLVKSQISQKAVADYSEMTSKQMTLLQLVKALEGVKRQMEADYTMISARYAKLFQSLNKALETRVKELDRPAMRLAEIRKQLVFDKLKDDSSLLLSVAEEALAVGQTALSGKLKQKTRETLQSLSGSVAEKQSYDEKIDSILFANSDAVTGGDEKPPPDLPPDPAPDPANPPAQSDFRYVPALFSATESLLNSVDVIENVYTPQADTLGTSIVSEISRVQPDLSWAPVHGEEKALVRKELISISEKEITDKRVSQEMLRLFDQTSWEALQR